jgi:hypothetical protein
VSTAELATTAAPARSARRPRSLTPGLTGARFYVALLVAALTVGALSLLIPSTPSYDPWSWILWGREIVHLDLQTTGGPTWKPLPMIFTVPFALFGKAAPDLWLVIARAGALMAAVMVFKVAATLTRALGTQWVQTADGTARERFTALAPMLLAGGIASVSLVLSGGFVSDNALGYSEGLMTAAVLIAVERHLDGKPRQAFAVGFLAALDRPEIWLFWGPYGLWLFWRDPGARKLVVALFVLIPVLWFLPEYWGSGHFLRGVSRAHKPRSNSAAFAHCPFCSELVNHAWPWMLLRIKVAAALGAAAAAALLWRLHHARGSWRLESRYEHALAALLGAAVLGLAWFVIVAAMTQAGFSGNDRYLVLGAALIDLAGGAAFGWAAIALGGWLARRRGAGGNGRAVAVRSAAVALLLVVYLIAPNWVGNNLISIQRTHGILVYQARLRTDAVKAIDELGGPSRVLACGTVMTEGFQVPMIAYDLGVHILRVESSPAENLPLPPAPNIVFQARANRGAHLLPLLRVWPNTTYHEVARLRSFRVSEACAGKVGA